MDRLAVVGSTRFVDERAQAVALARIGEVLDRRRPDLVVSGGAVGVDSWAVAEARRRGIATREFLPENPRWQPRGYRARNDQIADTCTRLLRIVCRWSTTYGSGYTADRAKSQDKLVWSVRVPSILDCGLILIEHGRDQVVQIGVEAGRVMSSPAARALGWANRDADELIGLLVRKRRVSWRGIDRGGTGDTGAAGAGVAEASPSGAEPPGGGTDADR